MLDEQFLHANAEPGGGDKLEKKKKTKCEKIMAGESWVTFQMVLSSS